jgi:hypothetical protein
MPTYYTKKSAPEIGTVHTAGFSGYADAVASGYCSALDPSIT